MTGGAQAPMDKKTFSHPQATFVDERVCGWCPSQADHEVFREADTHPPPNPNPGRPLYWAVNTQIG